MDNMITAFIQENRILITLVMGIVVLIGSIMNWNWLCDPTGAPDSQLYGRGSRRIIFLAAGAILIVVSVWEFVLGCK